MRLDYFLGVKRFSAMRAVDFGWPTNGFAIGVG